MTSALLIRLGGLGDLLVALPALRLVRATFPEANLHLLARKEYGGLLLEADVVNVVSAADDLKWMPLFDGSVPFPGEFRREMSRFDWVGGWFHGVRDVCDDQVVFADRVDRVVRGAGLCPGVKFRREGSSLDGRTRAADPGSPGGTGEDAGLRDFFESVSIPAPGALPPRAFVYDPASGVALSRFFFNRTEEFIREVGRAVPAFDDCRLLFPSDTTSRKRFAVVHPGSGSPRKCWPLDRFRRVIEALRERGLGGFLVSGEAEAGLEESLGRLPLPFGWRRLVRPPLADLAGLLRAAAIYVGNDSGVTHLAAACGVDAVAVFRAEFVAAWKPFGRCVVRSAPDMAEVAAEDVIAVVERVLDEQAPYLPI
jgi:ADP-heptose:LPS heptosyltransferase